MKDFYPPMRTFDCLSLDLLDKDHLNEFAWEYQMKNKKMNFQNNISINVFEYSHSNQVINEY